MNRYEHALAAIDALHDEDPAAPSERHYAEAMSSWLARFEPAADPLLRLAVRAQHLKRWERPRADYPQGREGYLRWRRDAAAHHAALVRRVMQQAGYDEAAAERVVALVRKARLQRDPQVQALEDCACMVFLERDLDAFVARHPADKVRTVLLRTWTKMSPRARAAAQTLPLRDSAARALADALASTSEGAPRV